MISKDNLLYSDLCLIQSSSEKKYVNSINFMSYITFTYQSTREEGVKAVFLIERELKLIFSKHELNPLNVSIMILFLLKVIFTLFHFGNDTSYSTSKTIMTWSFICSPVNNGLVSTFQLYFEIKLMAINYIFLCCCLLVCALVRTIERKKYWLKWSFLPTYSVTYKLVLVTM